MRLQKVCQVHAIPRSVTMEGIYPIQPASATIKGSNVAGKRQFWNRQYNKRYKYKIMVAFGGYRASEETIGHVAKMDEV